MVPPNRTMTNIQLNHEVSRRAGRLDNTIKLGKYCLERLSSQIVLKSIITTDDLAIKASGPIDHQGICGYIELHGYKARVINYNNEQKAIEVKHNE